MKPNGLAGVMFRTWWMIPALALCFAALPNLGRGQTVERIYDPFAGGAATTIYPGENALGAKDLADLLQWYAPGVQVTRMWNGEIEVSLRGGHASLTDPGGIGTTLIDDPAPPANPLLIVNGFEVSNDDFSWRLRTLSPFLVEKVVVLRDLASATIYGGRAARGVILVYTRRR